MSYQVAVSLAGEDTKCIICPTAKQAARVALVFTWSRVPDRVFSESDFYLTRRTSLVGWNSSDRSFSVTVTRV